MTDELNTNETTNKPSHIAYRVEGERKNAKWIKVGAQWPHKNGDGFDLILHGFDKSIRLVIRENK